MPHPTPSPAPISAAEHDDTWTEDWDHARAALRDLIDRAQEMAQLAHQHALTQAMQMAADPGPHHKYIDFTIAFERAARCVRRCIILRMKLHEPRPTGYDIALAAQKHAAGRERALQAIDPNAERAEHPERRELVERLDRLDDDSFNDMDRPLGEIIAEICADLGIALPQGIAAWAQRTPNNLIAADPPDREAARLTSRAIASAIPQGLADPPHYPLRL